MAIDISRRDLSGNTKSTLKLTSSLLSKSNLSSSSKLSKLSTKTENRLLTANKTSLLASTPSKPCLQSSIPLTTGAQSSISTKQSLRLSSSLKQSNLTSSVSLTRQTALVDLTGSTDLTNKLLETSTLTTSTTSQKRKTIAPDAIQIKRPKVVYTTVASAPELAQGELDIPEQCLNRFESGIDETIVTRPELILLNLVNRCLVQRTRFANLNTAPVHALKVAAEQVARGDDGEMLLQIALYARRALNIRTAANFLVALAAIEHGSKSHLAKYYKHLIVTPSDWIEVAQLNRDLNGTLSNALRVVMKDKFVDFDEYQLQKHNKGRKRTKKSENEVVPDPNSGSDDDEDDVRKGPVKLTMKNLIRTLHIKDPGYHVMGILGKLYPANADDFKHTRLDGAWDESRAGQRMKLATAVTWETELSAKGNTAEAWCGLINARKLPYMAALRNLRNIFLAGVKAEPQGKLLSYLSNRRAVEKSKQMPFQFYNAYNALTELEESFDEFIPIQQNQWSRVTNSDAIRMILKTNIKGASLVLTDAHNNAFNGDAEEMIESINTLIKRTKNKYDIKTKIKMVNIDTVNVRGWKKRMNVMRDADKKFKETWQKVVSIAKEARFKMKRDFESRWKKHTTCYKAYNSDKERIAKSLAKFKSAISSALASSLHNLPVVAGLSVFIINADKIDDKSFKQNLVLASCAQSCCQDSIFFLVHGKTRVTPLAIRRKDDLLATVEYWAKQAIDSEQTYTCDNYDTVIESIMYTARQISTISRLVVMSGTKPSAHILTNYRMLSNDKFKTFYIGMRGQCTNHEIYVDGCSEQVLMYMSESGKDNVMLEIQSLPAKFGIELSAFTNFDPLPSIAPRVKTRKIFISSTFADLAAKRDMLVDHILPELNQAFSRDNIELRPIDIRFDEMIHEADAIEAVAVCLRQVMECDLLVHIVANRYGTIPKYLYRGVHPPRGMEFLKHLNNVSITEAEVRCAILNKIPIVTLVDQACSNQRNLDLVNFERTVSSDIKHYTNDEDFVQCAREAISGIKMSAPRQMSSKRSLNIVGRRLLLDQAASAVFHSQLTCLRGERGMGKTMIMKWMFDLERQKKRRVAWFQCEPHQSVEQLLDELRQQLGIRIQPGQDRTLLTTKLPRGKISVFIDDAHHLDSISTWLPKIMPPELAIVFGKRPFLNKLFDNRIDNWLQINGLTYSDKRDFFEEHLSMKPISTMTRQLSQIKDSAYPEYMNLLCLGLKRFCYSIDINIPLSFDNLYTWLLDCATAKYGVHLLSCLELVKRNVTVNKELWTVALGYTHNGAKVNISHFDKMKIISALRDWAIVDSDVVTLHAKFTAEIRTLENGPNQMLLSACNQIINEEGNTGTAIEIAALLTLPGQLFACGQVEACHALLLNLTYLHKCAKSGILMNVVAQFVDYAFSPVKLAKLKSLFYLIHCEPDLIKGIIAEETGQETGSSDFRSIDARSTKTRAFARATFFALLKVELCVNFDNTSTYAVSLANGAVLLTDFDRNYHRIKFPSLNISTLSTSQNRLLICGSHFGMIMSVDQFTTPIIGELRLDNGPVISSSSNSTHFATIHHQHRAVCLWRATDAKLMWSVALNAVPSSIDFNRANSVYHTDCVLVGLWQPGQIRVLSLLDGKTIGKIHSPIRCSITAIGTLLDQNEPFLAAGHSNGDLTWYQARCGTMVAHSHSGGVNDPVKTIKQCDSGDVMFQSSSKIELWGRESKTMRYGSDIGDGDRDQTKVFKVYEISAGYIVIYKHGYIGMYSHQWRQINLVRPTLAGYVASRLSTDSTSRAISEHKLYLYTNDKQQVEFIVDCATGLSDKYEIRPVEHIIDECSGGEVTRNLHVGRIKLGKKSVEIVDLINYLSLDDLVIETGATFATGFVFVVTKSEIMRTTWNKLLGKRFTSNTDDLKLRFPDITDAYFQEDQTATGELFCAIACEYTNIRIFDVNLTLQRTLTSKSNAIINSVQLHRNMVISTQRDRVNVWSTKKSEVIASLKASVTMSGVLVDLIEPDAWDESMKLTESVTLADVKRIIVGTADGVVAWEPSKKVHIETHASGQQIKQVLPSQSGFVCVERESVWQFKLKSKTSGAHPTPVIAITQHNGYIVSVCSETVIVWSESGKKTTFELSGVKPLGFMSTVENRLKLVALDGNKFVNLFIDHDTTWKICESSSLKHFDSVKVLSVSWPRRTCDVIVGNKKLTMARRVHFDDTDELHINDTTPELSTPERVLYEGRYASVTSCGNRLTIFSSKSYCLDLGDHAIAADFMRHECRPYAIVATRTMLRLIRIGKDDAVVISSAIIKNEISSMTKTWLDGNLIKVAFGHTNGQTSVYQTELDFAPTTKQHDGYAEPDNSIQAMFS